MRCNQANEPDGSSEADRARRQKGHQDQNTAAQGFDIQAKAGGIAIAKAQRGQVPDLAQDKR